MEAYKIRKIDNLVHFKRWKLEKENQMRYLQMEMQKSLHYQIVSITEGSKFHSTTFINFNLKPFDHWQSMM